MGGLKTPEQNRASVAKHYQENKDEILRTKVLLRISQGSIPNKVSREKYKITDDEINRIRREHNLTPAQAQAPAPKAQAPTPKAQAPLIKELSLEQVKEYLSTSISNFNTFKTRYGNIKTLFVGHEKNILPILIKPKKFLHKHFVSDEAGGTNLNTLQVRAASLLYLVDHYPGLKEMVPFDLFLKIFETIKNESQHVNIQKGLTEKIEPFSEIKTRIENNYPPNSDEVLLINLYNELPRRRDFADIKIKSNGGTQENWLDVKTGLLHMNIIQKVHKDPFVHKLSNRTLDLIKYSLKKNPRETLLKGSYSKAMKVLGGVNLLRHAKVSEETQGEPDLEKRIALSKLMGHSAQTQQAYRRELETSEALKKLLLKK